jgi:DNA-binding NarL/FixJ family response regulator
MKRALTAAVNLYTHNGPASGQVSGKSSRLAGRRLDLWLVEDNDALRKAMVQLLDTHANIRCQHNFGSAEALVQALAAESVPDVVLTDLNLPRQSGIDLVKAVKTLAPALPVLVMTLFYDSLSERQALQSGAAAFLLKSDGFDQFAHLVLRAAGTPRPQESIPRLSRQQPAARLAPAAVDGMTRGWHGPALDWMRSLPGLRARRPAVQE